MSSTHKYWVTRIISAANSYSFFCILIVFRQTVTAGSVQETVDCASRVRNTCYTTLVTVFVLLCSWTEENLPLGIFDNANINDTIRIFGSRIDNTAQHSEVYIQGLYIRSKCE